MAASTDLSAYQQEYDAADRLYDEGLLGQCIASAKCNLGDTDLPPYYAIHNCILIACALDNWEDADVYRLIAEQTYSATTERIKLTENAESLEVLHEMREHLDDLLETRRKDMDNFRPDLPRTEDFFDYEENSGTDNSKEIEGQLEDPEVHAEAENQEKVAAESLTLPIRPARVASPTSICATDATVAKSTNNDIAPTVLPSG